GRCRVPRADGPGAAPRSSIAAGRGRQNPDRQTVRAPWRELRGSAMLRRRGAEFSRDGITAGAAAPRIGGGHVGLARFVGFHVLLRYARTRRTERAPVVAVLGISAHHGSRPNDHRQALMTFDSMTVIGQLQDLEQQIAATPQYVDSLQRAFARGDR